MEEDLLARLGRGDEKAFRQIFGTYYPLLSSHIFYITRSFELTQEIVQDVFLKIWIGREALPDIRDFKSYLWVMARNHALNALRKIARERTNRISYLEETEISADQPQPAENALFTLLDQAVAGLPPQQQKVFLLSRRHRLKQSEIAAELGITVSTVKKYMQLAVEFITKYIRDRGALLPLFFFFSLF